MSERIYQVIIGVLVLVVLVGGWMMVASKRDGASTTMGPVSADTATGQVSGSEENAASETTEGLSSSSVVPSQTASGEAVAAADQAAGNSVTVQSVTLKELGWVAVMDD